MSVPALRLVVSKPCPPSDALTVANVYRGLRQIERAEPEKFKSLARLIVECATHVPPILAEREAKQATEAKRSGQKSKRGLAKKLDRLFELVPGATAIIEDLVDKAIADCEAVAGER